MAVTSIRPTGIVHIRFQTSNCFQRRVTNGTKLHILVETIPTNKHSTIR